MSDRRFPVITGQSSLPHDVRARWPHSVPWSFVEAFRAQAEDNHDQTLEVLASRGGLAPEEMWLAAHGLRLFQKEVAVPSEQECGEWLIAEMKRIETRVGS